MTEFHERRKVPRVVVAQEVGGRAHAALDVRLLDVSTAGARIEHYGHLRLGSGCTLELPPPIGPLALSARVIRSTASPTDQRLGGERLHRYLSGLLFVGLTAEQQAALERGLEKLARGGDPGDARLAS